MEAPSDDPLFQAHAGTWHGFTRLLTIGTAIVVVLLILLALFLL